jgi:molybdopterin converting factor subunit 1
VEDAVKVRVRLFAMLREAAGIDSLELTIPPGGSIGSLVGELVEKYPRLGDLFESRHILVAVNQRYTGMDKELSEGDEVAFLPPVSGG